MNREKINIKFYLCLCFVVGALALFNIRVVEAATSESDRNIKVTREITLTDVQDYEALENEINNIQGGVIMQNNGGGNSAYYSLLIPRENFDNNLEKILQYGVVESDIRNQTDITNEVTRLENSIISNEEHKKVIMTMIEKAKAIDTILEFEQYLMEVEIEQTNNQNQLYGLRDLSNYTTLNLSIEKAVEDEPILEENFIGQLGSAFKDSFTMTISFFEGIVVGISYILIPLVFVGIIATVIIAVRKRGKNNEEK